MKRVDNNRKNKRNAKKNNTVTVIIGIVVVLIIFSNTVLAKNNIATKEIIVKSNNTIWDIAKSICKDNDKLSIQKVIIDIEKLNELDDSIIYEGQVLLVYEY